MTLSNRVADHLALRAIELPSWTFGTSATRGYQQKIKGARVGGARASWGA